MGSETWGLTNMLAQQVQTAIHTLFPPSCLGCRDLVTSDYGLCATCWRDLPLIAGPVCNACGVPVLAEDDDDTALCEDCTETPRPWSRGRAAMRYSGLAKRLVTGLKHYDRYDFAPAAAQWMARSAWPVIRADTVIAPVPLHWSRLVQRRYNQAAMLAHALGQRVVQPAILDLLIRKERTEHLAQLSTEERQARLSDVIAPNPKRQARLSGAHILLVDDVMVSGATLTACTNACLTAGAARVDVLVLARVAKDT